MTQDTSALFKPLQVGNLTLAHRLVMAPLTRQRASADHVPLPIMEPYYAQRACVPGTLLISEANIISPRGSGYANAPGIWNQAQVEAWKPITAAVHRQGCYIYCQLWALGRVATPSEMVKGADFICPSENAPLPPPSVSDHSATADGTPPLMPRALTEDEIWKFVEEYATAAKNAIDAGFDGVEVHGAHGYLIDQFIQDVTNTRDDKWGGGIENRARFAFEVVAAVVQAVGKDRVGFRLSPWTRYYGTGMKAPIPQFEYVTRGLRDLGLAYLHLVEGRADQATDRDAEAHMPDQPFVNAWFEGDKHSRPVILANGFNPDTARQAVDVKYKGKEIAVAFGRLWISNPDLAFRLENGLELSHYDRTTFYTPRDPHGYTDYAFSKEFGKFEAKA